MNRDDISEYLVHWTKGNNYEDAFRGLISICLDGALKGGGRGVFGGEKCVCFTEAPAEKFHGKVIGHFKPFGIQVEKRWAFERGGRPVIYQPREDLEKLHKSIHWKHVDFSYGNSPQSRNYTWQREWRVKEDLLNLPSQPTIIVPDKEWCNKLIAEFSNENLIRGCEENMDMGYYYTYNPVLGNEYTILWLE
ncbi:hypothetical protein [Erwinia sp. 198]|uniref:hypothetical protein n=1 Tax=Erwinia sp. 198 TaxID=2022746 RepID=UPI000F674751|nr:hypothetical protein [Erwinia sp. 198]